jgi:hypothetical protein
MRKILVTGVGIFLTALLAGYFFAYLPGKLPPFPSSLPFEKKSSQRSQENLLVILVDDLNASPPILESIWMIYFYPAQQPNLVMMPVYPSGKEESDQKTKKDFHFIFLGGIPKVFWKDLEDAHHLNWDHYLVVDHITLGTFLSQVTGKSAPKSLALPYKEGKTPNFTKVTRKLASTLCTSLKAEEKNPNLAVDWYVLKGHIKTDITVAMIQDNWDWIWINTSGKVCNIIK